MQDEWNGDVIVRERQEALFDRTSGVWMAITGWIRRRRSVLQWTALGALFAVLIPVAARVLQSGERPELEIRAKSSTYNLREYETKTPSVINNGLEPACDVIATLKVDKVDVVSHEFNKINQLYGGVVTPGHTTIADSSRIAPGCVLMLGTDDCLALFNALRAAAGINAAQVYGTLVLEYRTPNGKKHFKEVKYWKATYNSNAPLFAFTEQDWE